MAGDHRDPLADDSAGALRRRTRGVVRRRARGHGHARRRRDPHRRGRRPHRGNAPARAAGRARADGGLRGRGRPGGRPRGQCHRASPAPGLPEPARLPRHALLSPRPCLGPAGPFRALPQPDGEGVGEVVFSYGGNEHRLVAWGEEDDSLWILFRDATSGVTTYPANRQLLPAPPAPDGTVGSTSTGLPTCPAPTPTSPPVRFRRRRTRCRSPSRPASTSRRCPPRLGVDAVPTNRACLVDVFETVVTSTRPRGAAVAGQAGTTRCERPPSAWRCPRWRDA